ncbi:uncharacterized protein LOC100279159 [Zea mays]|uniref:Uncharacterized protein n=1 Tax=Zea mays TaxID=4577 RepID=C0PN67_MAIZE|nr:uncharacterized protein LOC100279159 [Zea mays]ACN36633.1 unknown [Zea mays]|eukprot:NP_001145662.2 uncharacterized protein LOC100279159 [Zea mays]
MVGLLDRSTSLHTTADRPIQARKQPAMWKWLLLWCPPPPPPPPPPETRWWWMMPWTRRKWSTPQGMVMAPFCSKPYSSSAALSSATKSGCVRYPTGTTNRSSSSSSSLWPPPAGPTTRTAIHPLGGIDDPDPPPSDGADECCFFSR